MSKEQEILEMIKEPLKEIDIMVDDITYIREGNVNFLRIFIDKVPFVEVDDCVKAAKAINPILDKEDIIKESYILDVCSKEKGGNE